MSWKAIGIHKEEISNIWQLYYAVEYGIFLKTIEELDDYFKKRDDYLEEKNRTTSLQATGTI